MKALFHQKIESSFFSFKPRNFGKIIKFNLLPYSNPNPNSNTSA